MAKDKGRADCYPQNEECEGKKISITPQKVSRADGYEVYYSASSKFAKSKTKKMTVKAAAGRQVTITTGKLSINKTYYIRARAYKTDSAGKRIYGRYSKVKKAAVKK